MAKQAISGSSTFTHLMLESLIGTPFDLLPAPSVLAGVDWPIGPAGLMLFGGVCLLLGAAMALVLVHWHGAATAVKASAFAKNTPLPAAGPDAVPAQLVVLDFDLVRAELQRLRGSGLKEIREKLVGDPALVEKLFTLVRVVTANRRATEENYLSTIAEFVDGFGRQKWAPYRKLFPAQLQALWFSRRLGEEEVSYTDCRGQARACYTKLHSKI